MAVREDRIHRPPLRRRLRRKRITEEDAELTIKYLKNPTSTGLFKLECTWQYDGGISKDLKTLIENSKHLNKEDSMYERRALASVNRLTEDPQGLFLFFHYLLRIRDDVIPEREHIDLDEVTYRLANLDLKPLVQSYEDALSYFEKNILYPDFFMHGNLSFIKSGNFLIRKQSSGASDEKPYRIDFVSLSGTPLETIETFLKLVNKINDSSRYTAFSPEEELLAPYVDILNSALPRISMSPSLRQHFDKMIGDYDDQNFTGCVSTASLIAEECLSQVYETIARKPVLKNRTLGQLTQDVGVVSRTVSSPKAATKKVTQNSVLDAIKKIKPPADPTKYALSINKLMLSYIESNVTSLKDEWRVQKEDNVDYRIFPEIIKMSLDDVITYRNAASHKSTDPIDSLKALKSIYGSLSLTIWWEYSRKTIDGSKTQKETCDHLMELAKQYV